jgi:serine/threonine protein kinase
MLVGNSPFFSENRAHMFQQIKSGKVLFPSKRVKISDNAKDLIIKLLDKNPYKRLKDKEIRNHPWFDEIDFSLIE